MAVTVVTIDFVRVPTTSHSTAFTQKECVLAEKHYPLGYFAVEFLEVDRTLLRELERLVPIFQEEFTVFLSARDPSSAALAQQALNAVWDVLIQMPVYFLAMGAYDTRYCMRIAPGETVKTCRQVGAHRKEKQRNGTEFVRKEYQKVYNRLRGRKNRGIISVDEWNWQVAVIQELKAQAIWGKISDVELKCLFEKI